MLCGKMVRGIDWRNVMIALLSLLLLISIGYIAYNEYQGNIQGYYLKGVRDGQNIILNNIVRQLNETGMLRLSINTEKGLQNIVLIPLKNFAKGFSINESVNSTE